MRLNTSPMEVRNALSEGVDSEGGYLVPDEFERTDCALSASVSGRIPST